MNINLIESTGGLTSIYDTVQSQCPGVSFTSVQAAVFRALSEFCVKSTYYRQTVPWTLSPGQTGTTLSPGDGFTTVVNVLNVIGLRFFQIRPVAGLVDLGDATTVRTGTALLVCRPATLNESFIPPFLMNDYGEALECGALMRLYAQPSKPWSNPPLAATHAARFYSEIRRARDTARRFGDYGEWTFPYFAGGNRRRGGAFGQASDGSLNTGSPMAPGPFAFRDFSTADFDAEFQ